MAVLSPDAVSQQLQRGDAAPVYYLTGDEDVMKEELAATVAAAVLDASTRDFNLDVRSAADLDGEGFHTLVETLPLLADRRVVVIKNIELWRKNAKVWDVVGAYLKRPSPTTVLVLVHGAGEAPDERLARQAVRVHAAPLSGPDLGAWVSRRAEKAGLQLEPEAAEHLVAAVGSDLGHLGAEIDKLAAVGSQASVADVTRLVGVRQGETLADWVAAVLHRDIPRAVQLVDVVLPQGSVTAVRMVMVLGTELIGVRLARALADSGVSGPRLTRTVKDQLAAARPPGLGNWDAHVRAWLDAATRWTAGELDQAIRAAGDTDRALKSTGISDDAGTLRAMLLALGQRQEAA